MAGGYAGQRIARGVCYGIRVFPVCKHSTGSLRIGSFFVGGPELDSRMTDFPTYAELKADAMDRLVARLVKHDIPEAEARQRLEATWNAPPALPLPTSEELDAMPDPVADISDEELEATLEADAARLAASWRNGK